MRLSGLSIHGYTVRRGDGQDLNQFYELAHLRSPWGPPSMREEGHAGTIGLSPWSKERSKVTGRVEVRLNHTEGGRDADLGLCALPQS